MASKPMHVDGPFGIIQKLLASFLCIALFSVTTGSPSFSQVPGLAGSVATNAAALGGLAVGIHGLVNDAISQANNDLADRLKQLEQIVNGALFSLTTAMNYGIDKMDFAAQSNVRVLNDNATQLLAKYGALTHATLKDAQKYLNDDIDSLGNKFGNALAQIDILNTTPILNVPNDGIAIFRGPGNDTKILLTGVGLTKLSVVPEVKLLSQDGKSTPVTVESYSMAFLKLSIPTNLLSRFGNYTLLFNFCTGRSWGFKQYGEQKVPVLACSIPRITIRTKIWVEGDDWTTRIRQVKQGNLGGDGSIYGVQCGSGNGSCPPRDITVQADPGWELYDPGWSRLINCPVNAQNGYTSIEFPNATTCRIYCDGRNGNCHLNVIVQVAERQRAHKAECAQPFEKDTDLIGTVPATLEFSRATLNGDCDSGTVLKALFKSSYGDAITDLHGSLAQAQVSIDVGDGIVSLNSAPRCVEKEYGKAIIH